MEENAISRRNVLAAGAAVGVAGALGLGRTPLAHAEGGGAAIALTHVTVIDATGARPQPDMTVIVRNGRIAALGHDVVVPEGAQVVNLKGKYVIPGLFDMHVHSQYPEGILPQSYIATGITSARDMMGFDQLHQWRDRIEAGKLLGPRWTIGSPILDGKPSLWDGTPGAAFAQISGAKQGRREVRKAKRGGADFIKIYSRLDRESFLAIADEARHLRLPVCGHAADAIPIVEAAKAGQRSFEHFFPALFGVSSKETEVRRLIDGIKIRGKGVGIHDWFAAIHPADWLACTTYDPHRAADVYAQLKAAAPP
ncbi:MULTISPECIES: twin-arginine translocation signal domain-containing protein [unclassified Nonomuraea]|uniref:amidohydrolase family protein n=1 Tax=unclassified Nonomuraea TaxID=2593643 RepID=UPI0033C73190